MSTSPKIIVSLTSFPEVLPYAIQAIRSILKGTVLPDKIVLYLDSYRFPEGVLPVELTELLDQNKLVEVRFDPAEIRSYKKLIPALRDFPEDVIVTIDDDIDYHPDLLYRLIRYHKKLPKAIIAHRARLIKLDAPYSEWRKFKWYDFIFKRKIFTRLAMQTGVGGVLYPPHSLDENMFDASVFMQLAPTNDDIWFWAAAVSKGTYVVPLPKGHSSVHEIGKPKQYSLKTVNLKEGDDRNRRAFDNILNRYPLIKKRIKDGE